MSLPLWGLLLLAFGVVIYVLLLAFARLDAMEQEQEDREIDRAVPVWSRRQLYDWQEAGDL